MHCRHHEPMGTEGPRLGMRAGQTLPLDVSCTTGKPLCAVSRSTWRSRCRGTRSCSTTTGDAITSVTCNSPGLISGQDAGCWQLGGHLTSADPLTVGGGASLQAREQATMLLPSRDTAGRCSRRTAKGAWVLGGIWEGSSCCSKPMPAVHQHRKQLSAWNLEQLHACQHSPDSAIGRPSAASSLLRSFLKAVLNSSRYSCPHTKSTGSQHSFEM